MTDHPLTDSSVGSLTFFCPSSTINDVSPPPLSDSRHVHYIVSSSLTCCAVVVVAVVVSVCLFVPSNRLPILLLLVILLFVQYCPVSSID